MTFLPIVDRELRVASRKRATFWMRSGMGLAAIAVGAIIQMDASSATTAYLGQRLFRWLTWIGFVYCLLAGRRSTADCLSSEKRDGTLGLLFLTDLKGYDVVLGKLMATSLNGFYGLLAIVPVLAAPLLLGGVTSGEFWRVVLVMVVTFFFSLSAGILVSAPSRDSRKAFGANLLLLLGIAAIPPALAGALANFLPRHAVIMPLFYSCPFFTLALAQDGNQQGDFWASTAVIAGLGLLMMATASVIAPRSWQERVAGAKLQRWHAFWYRWTYGTPGKREAYRKHLLNRGAYYWLAARGRLKPVQVWVLLAVIAVWWTWLQIQNGSYWQNDALNPLNITAAIMANTTLKLWICIEAGRQLAEDRRSGAFELLLTSSLKARDILVGQWRALFRQFSWPLLAVLALEIFGLFEASSHAPISESFPDGTFLWVCGIAILLADLITLGWVAMWTALTARSANQAIIGAVVRVLAPPWFLLWVVNASLSSASAARPASRFFVILWFASSLATDAFFGATAWKQLRQNFRLLAIQPFNPQHSWWQKLLKPVASTGEHATT